MYEEKILKNVWFSDKGRQSLHVDSYVKLDHTLHKNKYGTSKMHPEWL